MIAWLKRAWRRRKLRKHYEFWAMMRSCTGPHWTLDDHDYPIDPRYTSRAALFGPCGEWAASFEFSPITGLEVLFFNGESSEVMTRKVPDLIDVCVVIDTLSTAYYDRRYRQALKANLEATA